MAHRILHLLWLVWIDIMVWLVPQGSRSDFRVFLWRPPCLMGLRIRSFPPSHFPPVRSFSGSSWLLISRPVARVDILVMLAATGLEASYRFRVRFAHGRHELCPFLRISPIFTFLRISSIFTFFAVWIGSWC